MVLSLLYHTIDDGLLPWWQGMGTIIGGEGIMELSGAHAKGNRSHIEAHVAGMGHFGTVRLT